MRQLGSALPNNHHQAYNILEEGSSESGKNGSQYNREHGKPRKSHRRGGEERIE